MRRQTALLCLALAAPAGYAQTGDSLTVGPIKRGWLAGTSLGLSVRRSDSRLPCASARAACDELSVVGRASFGASGLGLYGRLGSGIVRTYTPLGAESGFGLSYGAGLSWELGPRAVATVGWDTYDLRLGGSVRATSLGLQWRY